MAYFDPIYQIVVKHEGGYANVPGDKGGMTYKGIARNIHPRWSGWYIVDGEIQKNGGGLPRNHFIDNPYLDVLVRDFYLDLYNKSKAGDIINQQVAALYFDFYVNSGKAIREIQKVLISEGFPIAADNLPGMQTVNAINSHNNQGRLHELIKMRRISYLKEVAQYGSNRQFLPGWLKRVASFTAKNETRVKLGIGTLIIIGIGIFLITNNS